MLDTGVSEQGIPREKLLQIYRTMLLIRNFEERVRGMFQGGQLPRHGHLYTGQEAVAAGALAAVNDDDYMAITHRGHGPAIARTRDLKGCLAELSGKKAGFCHGKGGSMHIADFDKAMLGAFPIVGASIPMGVGGGLAAKVLRNGRVSIAFFGDGASNQGTFHEGINLAAVLDLPVIFICENNGYAIATRQEKAMRVKDIAGRAVAYGIPGVTVDGNDALEMYQVVRAAADRARAGRGPTLIEAKTYRWGGHHTGDPGTYRSQDEIEAWKRKDPIPRFRSHLLNTGTLSEAEAKEMEGEAGRLMEEAVAFASSCPAADIAEAFADLYAPEYTPDVTEPSGEVRELTCVQAINEAIREEMDRDPRLVILGEDVAARGGPFGATMGLFEQFGPSRVIDTPVSESGFTGAAVAAALAGVPTIAEISFIDFTTVGMDPIVNVAAKARYMSAGKQRVPFVLRTQEGAGGGGAATHSQSLEAWFAHIPGLKVVLPSTPFDYKGLLKTAIRDPNPVVFIEHKMLYRTKGPVPAGEYAIPFGKAIVRRPGKDVTVVALAAMVPKALAAAETVAAEGIEVEVIDPRTLAPLDMDTIARSVQRTGRLVVFQEAYVCGGFGSEIARRVGEAAFGSLKAPVKVVGSIVPFPFSPPLEAAVLPGEKDLIQAIRTILQSSPPGSKAERRTTRSRKGKSSGPRK
jgi:pyruvate/2-oxoglutarate/acetoin dehydrogenase E1 component/TPP-dependent pyruvate/acetoin dehydrogenase alpha subunit